MNLLQVMKQSFYLGKHDISVFKKDGVYQMKWKNFTFNIPDTLDDSLRIYLHREFQWKITEEELRGFESWLKSPYAGDLTNLDIVKQQAMI